eukprot:m.385279 g.385279  ORF g.385279 m.385279 type:complete len:331 (-) comp21005_c0_seq8:925-1917(-)
MVLCFSKCARQRYDGTTSASEQPLPVAQTCASLEIYPRSPEPAVFPHGRQTRPHILCAAVGMEPCRRCCCHGRLQRHGDVGVRSCIDQIIILERVCVHFVHAKRLALRGTGRHKGLVWALWSSPSVCRQCTLQHLEQALFCLLHHPLDHAIVLAKNHRRAGRLGDVSRNVWPQVDRINGRQPSLRGRVIGDVGDASNRCKCRQPVPDGGQSLEFDASPVLWQSSAAHPRVDPHPTFKVGRLSTLEGVVVGTSAAVIINGTSVIAGKKDDRVLVHPLRLQRGNYFSNLRVQQIHHGVIPSSPPVWNEIKFVVVLCRYLKRRMYDVGCPEQE